MTPHPSELAEARRLRETLTRMAAENVHAQVARLWGQGRGAEAADLERYAMTIDDEAAGQDAEADRIMRRLKARAEFFEVAGEIGRGA